MSERVCMYVRGYDGVEATSTVGFLLPLISSFPVVEVGWDLRLDVPCSMLPIRPEGTN